MLNFEGLKPETWQMFSLLLPVALPLQRPWDGGHRVLCLCHPAGAGDMQGGGMGLAGEEQLAEVLVSAQKEGER